MKIKYVIGDATRPFGSGNKIIVHICNDIGAWGSGFVMAVSRRWREPQRRYRLLGQTGRYKLGTIELVPVESDIWVVNMIAQHDIRTRNHLPPIRYSALGKCLNLVAVNAKEMKATIHMPRIGCGLAGGTWNRVLEVVSANLADLEVTVYDLAG